MSGLGNPFSSGTRVTRSSALLTVGSLAAFQLACGFFADLLLVYGAWSGWSPCSEAGIKNQTLLCQEEALPYDMQGTGFCQRVMASTLTNITNTTTCLPGKAVWSKVEELTEVTDL